MSASIASGINAAVPGSAAATPLGLRISVVIMAHPRRMESASRVVAAHPELAIRVITDPEPDGPRSALRTARLAWAAMLEGSTHHVVIQDDVQATVRLSALLPAAIAAMPDAPLAFFTEWGCKTAQMVRLAAIGGFAFAEIADYLHTCQAVALPANIATEYVQHLQTPGAVPPDSIADADVLFGFFRQRGLTPYVTVPNLVEHLELPSLMGTDLLRGPRLSPCFAPNLDDRVDWQSGRFAVPDVLAYFSTQESRSNCQIRSAAGSADTSQTLEWLVQRGVSLDVVSAEFLQRLHRLHDVGRVRATVADTLLFQLWATWLATGIVLAESEGFGADKLSDGLGRPLAQQALATMIPGALRKILPLPATRWLGLELSSFFADAVLAGSELTTLNKLNGQRDHR